MIEVKNVRKKFDSNIILDNVNIKFEQGKIYGFIGRNGSGKSVLFKIICGLYKPTSGCIVVDGEILKNEFLPNTRVLIESPCFLPDQTGFNNLKLLADIQSTIDDNRINQVLDDVNLSKEDRNKKYYKYSLGMKQKLGIAQVLMESPRIMILDEPFNGVEKDTVIKIKKILMEEKKKSKIILIASHIKEDIISLSDVVYEVDAGKVSVYKDDEK